MSFFKISTQSKLRIAKLLSLVFSLFFRLLGKDPRSLSVKRGGLRWNLDLSEGIDLYIFIFGKFEVETAHFFMKYLRPGMVVLDIGANIGAHALPMAKAVENNGLVYAIEPTSWAFEKLRINHSLNPEITSLHIFQAGFLPEGMQKPEAIESSWNVGAASFSSINEAITKKNTERTEFISFDAFVDSSNLQRLDLVKLDVDGFECSVLKSGIRSLRRLKPAIVIELCPSVLESHNTSLKELLSILSELGYELFSLVDIKRLPTESSSLELEIPKSGGTNALALHPDKKSLVE